MVAARNRDHRTCLYLCDDSADERLKEQREVMAVVGYNGSVLWIPPAIFKSTCEIDITYFPYDIQGCRMKFGSWTYDGFQLDIFFTDDNASVDVSNYIASNEWKLIGYPAKKNLKYYQGLVAPYPDLTFYIYLQRVPMFHKYILILPCVLLSCLTLVIFWLPPESPAKVMLGMSVFVAFFVLLLLLADSTPPAASNIPLIGAYFCINMVLITLSTFIAAVIIQTHIRGDRKNKVSPWLKRIAIDGMARILCMGELIDKDPAKPSTSSSSHASRSSTARAEHQSHSRPQSKDRRSTPRNQSEPSYGSCVQPSPVPAEPAGLLDRSPVHCPVNPALEADVRDIRRLLKTYITRLEAKDAAARAAKEWRIVARVLDRLIFFCYIGVILVSRWSFFPSDMSHFYSTEPPTDAPPTTAAPDDDFDYER